MWFREAFHDQINPSWENVNLNQLDKICDKIDELVNPDKKNKPTPLKSSSPPFDPTQPQYFYQNITSFFDNDDEANDEHSLYTFSPHNRAINTEETSLLSAPQGGKMLRSSQHTYQSPSSTSSTPTTFSYRAMLQREQSLALLQSAATPLQSLSPQLQKLETLYAATFLAELESVTSFFTLMQSRVQSEILLLFAKCIEVLKIKHHVYTSMQLTKFLQTHPDHTLNKIYSLCQHFLTIFEHFNQPTMLPVSSSASYLDLDTALVNFSNFHLESGTDLKLHVSQPNHTISPSSSLPTPTLTTDITYSSQQHDLKSIPQPQVAHHLEPSTCTLSTPTLPISFESTSRPLPSIPTPYTFNSNQNLKQNTTAQSKILQYPSFEEELPSIELSFRELSRCLHLLSNNFLILNKSALLQSLQNHDNTGTPLKLSHQMGGQVNRTDFSINGSKWAHAVTSLVVESYATFFNISDKKRAWKLLKSQAVSDQIQEPRLNSILSMAGLSTFLMLVIVILLLIFPQTHIWLISVLPLWRFSMFVVTFLFGLATLIYYCIKTNINYIFLFGLNPLSAYTHKSLYFHSATLSAVTAACMLVCLSFSIADVHSLMFLPHTILTCAFGYYFFLNRSYLIKCTTAVIFCEATFQSSWVGDQLCSLTRLMGDLLYIIIFYAHCILNLHSNQAIDAAHAASMLFNPTTILNSTTSTISATKDSLINSHNPFLDQSIAMGLQTEVRLLVKQCMWFITITPFILRAIQCLRSYYHQSNYNPRHLGNTAKYLAAITMSTFALLYKQALSFAPRITRATTSITSFLEHQGYDAPVANAEKASFFIPIFSALFSSSPDPQAVQTLNGATNSTQFVTQNVTAFAGVIASNFISNTTTPNPIDDIASIGEIYSIWIDQLQWIFLVSAIATTLFQLIWDFYIDWCLFENSSYFPFRKKTIFRKNFLKRMGKLPNSNNPTTALGNTTTAFGSNSTLKTTSNRSPQPLTIIPTTRSQYNALNKRIGYIYFSAMVANTIMRCFWIETLLPWTSVSFFGWSQYSSYLTTDFTVLILGMVEIVRRCLWSYFRLEAQQVNNNAEYMPVHFKIPEIHTQRLLSLSQPTPSSASLQMALAGTNSSLNESTVALRGSMSSIFSPSSSNSNQTSIIIDKGFSHNNNTAPMNTSGTLGDGSGTLDSIKLDPQAPRFNRTSSLMFSPQNMYVQQPGGNNDYPYLNPSTDLNLNPINNSINPIISANCSTTTFNNPSYNVFHNDTTPVSNIPISKPMSDTLFIPHSTNASPLFEPQLNTGSTAFSTPFFHPFSKHILSNPNNDNNYYAPKNDDGNGFISATHQQEVGEGEIGIDLTKIL